MKDANLFPWITWDHTTYVDRIVTANKTSITTGYFPSAVERPVYTIWTVEIPPEEETKEESD